MPGLHAPSDPPIQILRPHTQSVAEASGGEVAAGDRAVHGAPREAADARDLLGGKQRTRVGRIRGRTHASTESIRPLLANEPVPHSAGHTRPLPLQPRPRFGAIESASQTCTTDAERLSAPWCKCVCGDSAGGVAGRPELARGRGGISVRHGLEELEEVELIDQGRGFRRRPQGVQTARPKTPRPDAPHTGGPPPRRWSRRRRPHPAPAARCGHIAEPQA